jgi:hypothetical protein
LGLCPTLAFRTLLPQSTDSWAAGKETDMASLADPAATVQQYIDAFRCIQHRRRHGNGRDLPNHVTLGKPLHANITDGAAYVVVPATMTFKLKGQQVTQSGTVLTVALRKLPAGWRIASWAWAKGTV